MSQALRRTHLEEAIRAVQRDNSLDEAAKKRRVDWFEELKIVVRTFGIEGAKAVPRGDIPRCRRRSRILDRGCGLRG